MIIKLPNITVVFYIYYDKILDVKLKYKRININILKIIYNYKIYYLIRFDIIVN
ncbi:MAG: hypothetical protein ArsCj_4880 [Arsenophonus endosymbiont of Ceratovacuna japonica]